jgi:gamma-glutamyltranspeptidase / glutathione hydrolase
MKKLPIALVALAIVTSPASAQNVGVTSSADPRVTDAGMEMLRQGGTAADAAMAMMLTLTVVEPQSSGIGGGGFLLYQDAAKGVLSTINGRETAPSAATPDRFVGPDGKALGFLQAFQGGRSVGVPGNVRLMAEAHKKWGKLAWAKLFKPAIRLAEKGFVVNKTLESRLQGIQPLWSNFDEAKSIYWVNGAPVKLGATFKNPKLAATLKLIAKKGPDAFYKGKIAGQIVNVVTTSKLSPGDMTMSDLAQYRAKEQQAVCAPYRVYVICGMGPPSSGATTVLQILGSLERFDLTATGQDNAQSWHLVAEAMRLAYADREKYLGDSDFVDVPVKGLLDPQYIKQRSALIDPKKARADYPAGNPPGAGARTAAISSEVAGTTHFTAVDANGSIANMTSTIEGPFGSQLIAGGFFLNNELTDFTFAPEKNGAPVANRVVAGKRPLSSMSPTIVFDRDGKAVLALGSAGGKRIIMHVTKTLIGVIDFGLPLDKAIALPNLYFGDGQIEVEQETSLAAMSGELAKYGQKVSPVDLGSKVNGAQLTSNGWVGASDPRSEGSSATLDANGKVTVTVPRASAEAPSEDVG